MSKHLPTIKEIAKMLNISISTVSRALRDDPGIGSVTTKRVKEVAKELGYEPNQTALFLKNGKTFTLGVIVPDLTEFFAEAITGIEDAGNLKKYTVFVGQSRDEVQREKKIVEAMKNHRVDGLLVSLAKDTTDYEHFTMLKKYDIPIVFFDRVPDMSETHTVTCRLETGMREAIDLLVEKGHSRIALINGPPGLVASKNRQTSYKSSLERCKITCHLDYIVHTDLTTESTARAMQKLLTLSQLPTAVITFNDYVAMAAMRYCRNLKIRINLDLSFVSFANFPVTNFLENPPLASVEQFPYRQGQLATEMLLDILNKNGKDKRRENYRKAIVEPRLFIYE